MLFSINEDGDLDIDNNKYFSDFVMSDKIETDYRISRTLLLTHLIHKKWLEKNFILYKRNNFSDSEIRELIQKKINDIFQNYQNLLNLINFHFINDKSSLNIIFYKKEKEQNKLLLHKEIIIG
jgi:ribonuclease P protein component